MPAYQSVQEAESGIYSDYHQQLRVIDAEGSGRKGVLLHAPRFYTAVQHAQELLHGLIESMEAVEKRIKRIDKKASKTVKRARTALGNAANQLTLLRSKDLDAEDREHYIEALTSEESLQHVKQALKVDDWAHERIATHLQHVKELKEQQAREKAQQRRAKGTPVHHISEARRHEGMPEQPARRSAIKKIGSFLLGTAATGGVGLSAVKNLGSEKQTSTPTKAVSAEAPGTAAIPAEAMSENAWESKLWYTWNGVPQRVFEATFDHHLENYGKYFQKDNWMSISIEEWLEQPKIIRVLATLKMIEDVAGKPPHNIDGMRETFTALVYGESSFRIAVTGSRPGSSNADYGLTQPSGYARKHLMQEYPQLFPSEASFMHPYRNLLAGKLWLDILYDECKYELQRDAKDKPIPVTEDVRQRRTIGAYNRGSTEARKDSRRSVQYYQKVMENKQRIFNEGYASLALLAAYIWNR